MADTIYLDSFAMDKLICLCAHDFKHDFIEDSDRPKLALVGEGIGIPGGGNPKLQYHGTSSTTETVDEGETIEAAKDNLKMGTSSLVFPGTPLSEEEKYVVNPEDFPLACYIYLNIADMCKNDEAKTLDMFNKFCDNLGKINGRIGLQKKKSEARQKKREAIDAEAQQSSKKRRKGGGKTAAGGSLISGKPLKMRHKSKLPPKMRHKNGQGTQNRTEKTAQRQRGNRDASIRAFRNMAPSPSTASAAASRPRRSRPPAGAMADSDDVGPINSNKLIEWDKMLEIYKEWLSSDGRNEFYQDLNNLLNTQNFTPNEFNKRTFLIPSSEWESYEGRKEHGDWARLMSGRVKNAFDKIIKQCFKGGDKKEYPRMVSLKISTKKWDNIKQFSLYLLNEWEELVIANPGDDQIYHKDKISELRFKDKSMWSKSEEYYKKNYLPPHLIDDKEDECNPKPCKPFRPVDPPLPATIINNSAILSKYINNPENYYKCPIPSIIDPQSVCNSIPPSDIHLVTDENPIGIPADYSVNVVDPLRRTISVQIESQPYGGDNRTKRFLTSISFNGVINGSVINNFEFGGGPLSAYNVTLLFIRGFLKKPEEEGGGLNEFGDWVNTEHTDPMSDPVTPFSQDKATLRSIAGIFALKLMGDFSQELYAISKNRADRPLLFLANDRVSVARYLLLKVHGKREAGGYNIIAEPGGGGFLGYSRPKNNYFLLMGPAPPGGGGKKKKKVKKTKTKTKRKSRKKKSRKKKSKKKKSRKKT